MRIYTRKGDDGTTGLLFGGRVPKSSPMPRACGAVDEAQAVLGVTRAEVARGSELDTLLIAIERDLWVAMSELATDPENRSKLVAGRTLVTHEMVVVIETTIDDFSDRFDPPAGFVVPGETRAASLLDLARTVVRRAERECLEVVQPDSFVLAYLNRLSDLLWTLARWNEGESLRARPD